MSAAERNQNDDIFFVVEESEEGMRLDRLCAARHPNLSRNQIQVLNENGGVTVDGRVRPDSYQVRAGENVEMRAAELHSRGWDPETVPVPEAIPIVIVHEDDDVVVVNKPAGMVVHPAHGNTGGTLVNALLGRGIKLAGLGGTSRPGIVHRLDKDTSGLMVVAKTNAAYAALVTMLKDRKVLKEYHAIVRGNIGRERMTIDAPVGRHPTHRQKMAVRATAGREALSQLFVVDSYKHFDYIRVAIYTGRTHQIRVHMSHVKHPLLGDQVYGGRPRKGHAQGPKEKVTGDRLSRLIKRHALHASRLAFERPGGGGVLTFQSALPDDMRLALETLYREDRFKEV
jgi:23S rRNA pseudouridine1911/1915/1917 synthase